MSTLFDPAGVVEPAIPAAPAAVTTPPRRRFVRRSRADHVAHALALPANAATGCVEWDRALSSRGYGRVKFDGRRQGYPVHRLVLEHHLGRSLGAEEVTRHSCDNPPCVNPAHLLVGSQADNIRDRDARQRRVAPVGEEHGCAILTDDLVTRARETYDAGFTVVEIIVILGLTIDRSTLSLAVSGRTWRHLPGACTMRPPGRRRR